MLLNIKQRIGRLPEQRLSKVPTVLRLRSPGLGFHDPIIQTGHFRIALSDLKSQSSNNSGVHKNMRETLALLISLFPWRSKEEKRKKKKSIM